MTAMFPKPEAISVPPGRFFAGANNLKSTIRTKTQSISSRVRRTRDYIQRQKSKRDFLFGENLSSRTAPDLLVFGAVSWDEGLFRKDLLGLQCLFFVYGSSLASRRTPRGEET
jgi:hypothetical protein